MIINMPDYVIEKEYVIIMKEMKWFIKMIISGILSICSLSLFNLLYSFSGIHYDNPSGATDYVWASEQLKTTMTEGFSWLKMDSAGFNNIPSQHEKKVDILLMGSSHMEAINVPSTANTGYLLNQYLPEFNTYNIGMSGHTIYRCVNNVANAYQTYAPSYYLIIETDTVALDINEMTAVITQSAPKIPSYDSGILYHLQKIPAIKWLYKQTIDWIDQEKSNATNNNVTTIETATIVSNEYKEILNDFLQNITKTLDGTTCKPIIFYHPVTRLDSEGNLVTSTDPGYLEAFSSACQNNGIIFIDMTERFQTLYSDRHILPHGFSNTEVGTGHLNKYGHQEIAQYLSEVIIKENNSNDIK